MSGTDRYVSPLSERYAVHLLPGYEIPYLEKVMDCAG